MFTLFEDYEKGVQPHYHFPEWDFVRRNMIENVAEVLERLHSRPRTLHKSNPLVNLLMSIGMSLDTPLDTYMRITEERSFYLTFVENFTSSSSYGRLFDGIFYGKGTRELIIVDTTDFDYKNYVTSWRTVAPVSVVLSDISDFSFLTPDGRRNWEIEDGFAVFTVNLKKLLFVYYMWNQEMLRRVKAGSKEMILGTHHMIMMVVLPNILISQINMIMFNRLMNFFYGRPMSKAVHHLPFTVKDLTRRVDHSLEHMLQILTNDTYTYQTLLTSIPAITEPNMYRFLMMPDLPLTRQINWAYAVARASIFRFVIELGGQKDVTMNRRLLVDARININLLRTEHVLKPRLTEDIYDQVKEDLDFIYDTI